MIIFSDSGTHAHLFLTYFKDDIIHVFSRLLQEKIIKACPSRTGLESEKQNPIIILPSEDISETDIVY